MTPRSEIVVTLSDDLFGHLRSLATVLEVPFEWLVAGIVCDTIECSPEIVPGRAAGPPRG
jgi:hypothetical protein